MWPYSRSQLRRKDRRDHGDSDEGIESGWALQQVLPDFWVCSSAPMVACADVDVINPCLCEASPLSGAWSGYYIQSHLVCKLFQWPSPH